MSVELLRPIQKEWDSRERAILIILIATIYIHYHVDTTLSNVIYSGSKVHTWQLSWEALSLQITYWFRFLSSQELFVYYKILLVMTWNIRDTQLYTRLKWTRTNSPELRTPVDSRFKRFGSIWMYLLAGIVHTWIKGDLPLLLCFHVDIEK